MVRAEGLRDVVARAGAVRDSRVLRLGVRRQETGTITLLDGSAPLVSTVG